MHEEAATALNILLERNDDIWISSQNLIEFWNVCTRPIDRNGLGMTVAQTDAELTRLEGVFEVLPDTPVIYAEWRRLVLAHSVMGVNVHDARLVAVMLVYGLTHILTFNTCDFRRFSEITVVRPSEITLEQTQK